MKAPIYPEQALSRAYLNTASNGLMSVGTGEVGQNYYAQAVANGFQFRESCVAQMPLIRQAVAEFLGTQTDHVALLGNFSSAMNYAAALFRPLRKVLLYRHDYPSLTLPFQANDYDIHFFDHNERLELDLNTIEAALRKHEIRVLAISWVQYSTGFRIDMAALGALCRSLDVRLLVDGSQSLGALQAHTDRHGIDFIAGSGYKWLCAGMGVGFMALRPEFLRQYRMPVLSNNHLPTFKNFDTYAEVPISVQAFEIGHPAHASFLLLQSAIQEQQQLGLEHIETHNLRLAAYAKRRFAEAGIRLVSDFAPENTSPILVFAGDAALFESLMARGIQCSLRPHGIRVSFHHYNTEADVDALLEACAAISPA